MRTVEEAFAATIAIALVCWLPLLPLYPAMELQEVSAELDLRYT